VFHGVFPVLHTPFTASGDIDEDSFARQIDFCIDAEVGGMVYPSMASEFLTLTDDERRDLTTLFVQRAAGRAPAVVGVTAATGRIAAGWAELATSLGADGALAMTQFPRQGRPELIIEYFEDIARSAPGLPLILQNPRPPEGNSVRGMALSRLLDAVPTIRYIKEEAVPSGPPITDALRSEGARLDGIFGGYFGISHIEDVRRGACGTMPGVGLADLQSRVQRHLDRGEIDDAFELQGQILPILQFLSSYSSGAHKELMVQLGIFTTNYVRAPHVPRFDSSNQAELAELIARSPLASRGPLQPGRA
jgi:4-hydroxy-tetrahydrodipicolinate synthase